MGLPTGFLEIERKDRPYEKVEARLKNWKEFVLPLPPAEIGKQGARITREQAMDHVAGYAIGLDMTMAGPENFTHNKCYDGFGIIGPWLVTADEIPDPRELSFRFYVNDELRQADKIERLNFDVQELIVFASSIATLYPGDIIMTGTPIGVAPVVPGDVMRTEFDVIGTMVTKVTGVV